MGTPNVDEVFRRLGERLEGRWRAANHDEAVFPQLALDALEELDELATLGPKDLLLWLVSSHSLPAQRDLHSKFGNLALGLHQASRFSISALFWLDGSTAIHQHAFSGAFRLFAGSSLQCRWQFREERAVNGRFRLGELSLSDAELLTTGQVRPIEGGARLIHSVFHLDPLSVTLVIRTEREPGVQWDYLRPGIARDPHLEDVTQEKKCQALRILLALGAEEAESELDALFASADLELTFHLLRQASRALRLEASPLDEGPSERFAALVRRAHAHHGDAVARLVEAAEWELRKLRILDGRGAMKDPNDRFFLGVLLNVTDRRRVLELLALRRPGIDPVETFVEGVERLGKARAPLLGFADWTPAHGLVLRRLLAGEAGDAAAGDLAAAQPDHDPAELRVRCREAVEALETSLLLGALLG